MRLLLTFLFVAPLCAALPDGTWRLTLKDAVYGGEQRHHLHLDLESHGGRFHPRVWAVAITCTAKGRSGYNKASHEGTLISQNATGAIEVHLPLSKDMWGFGEDEELHLKLHVGPPSSEHELMGRYDVQQSSAHEEYLHHRGKLVGQFHPGGWPHLSLDTPTLPPKPRLLGPHGRKLKDMASTPWGEKILERVHRLLKETDLNADTAASHAAAHALLYRIKGDAREALRARDLLDPLVRGSLKAKGHGGNLWSSNSKRIYRSSPLVHAALTYDLYSEAWPENYRTSMAGEILKRAKTMLEDTRKHEYNDNPASNHFIICNTAGGIAAMAVMGDLDDGGEAQRLADLARFNLRRHFDHPQSPGTLGSSGEGEAYANYAQVHLGPYLLASAHVQGRTWEDETRWLLTRHILTLTTGKQGLIRSAFGPYASSTHRIDRHGFDGIFATALSSVHHNRAPGVGAWFQTHLGLQGDGSFGMTLPHHGAYLLAMEAPNANSPIDLPLIAIDERKGWFNFRSGFMGKPSDTIITVYGKFEPGGGWSYDEAGGFRFIAKGTHWAWRKPSREQAGRGSPHYTLENSMSFPGQNGWGAARLLEHRQLENGASSILLDMKELLLKKGDDGLPEGAVAQRLFVVDPKASYMVIQDHWSGRESFKWNLHSQGRVNLRDGGFTLKDTGEHQVIGHVLQPKGADISTRKGSLAIPNQGKVLVALTLGEQRVFLTGEGLDLGGVHLPLKALASQL